MLVALVISLVASLDYRRDLRQARERIATGSLIANTRCGPIVVVHGAGGGFDQGMAFAEAL